MKRILISGLVNVETSLKVDSFPIEYSPIEYPFFGVSSAVSGVGYNIAKALTRLKDEVKLLSVAGEDNNGKLIRLQLEKDGIDTSSILFKNDLATAESVVLFDKEGRRKIYCDLKNLQELNPFDGKEINPKGFDLAILTNINFSRPLISSFKKAGIPIATDVHVLSNVHDEYNKDFLENADILFLSNEACIGREGDFLREIYQLYHNKIIVLGCGKEGALAYLGENGEYVYEPAVAPLGIKNTVGAGDALFASFLHHYLKSGSVPESLRFATMFAGLKIAASGGAEGFPDEKTVNEYLQ